MSCLLPFSLYTGAILPTLRVSGNTPLCMQSLNNRARWEQIIGDACLIRRIGISLDFPLCNSVIISLTSLAVQSVR